MKCPISPSRAYRSSGFLLPPPFPDLPKQPVLAMLRPSLLPQAAAFSPQQTELWGGVCRDRLREAWPVATLISLLVPLWTEPRMSLGPSSGTRPDYG